MFGSLTLPAIAFLATISGLPSVPGLPGLSGFKGLKGLPMPKSKEYARAKAEATAADTLPIPWKPWSRQALDHQFVTDGLSPIGRPTGPIKLLPAYDPRKVRVSVDSDSGVYHTYVEVGEVPIGPGYRSPLGQYSRDLVARSFRDRWTERSRRDLISAVRDAPAAPRQGGISVPLPVRLPQRVQSILGPGGPSLTVSGSESIRLSGTSNWTNQELSVIGQKKSLFPSLDMQQDLDIRLEGQLSDRIKVNLLQNSANQVPLANKIAINYRGDEDDFIQALDLGNTSLALPGTQYVSYSGKNEGLFGIKLASRIGALDFTALASKQEGRSERAVYSGGASRSLFTFTDVDWVKGQYFLLYDPNFGTVYDIDQNSIRLYLDDALATNDLGKVIPGKAMLDPAHAMSEPLPVVSDTAFVRGSFDILNPGPDQGYEVLNNVYAFHDTIFKVIRLKQPIQLQSNQALAVTYRALPIIGPNHALGAPIDVGGTILTAAGPDSGRTLMKLLRVPRNLQSPTADGLKYDSTAAFAPVRELELKNIYNLGGFGIDPKSFKLRLAAGQEEPPVTDLDGVPFIEMAGLDNWDEQSNQARRGHDGEVDATGFNSQTRGWVDYANGTLFMPDARPFSPRLTGPDLHPFDRVLDDQVNRRRRLDGVAGERNVANPEVYDLYNPRPQDVARWYFTAEFAAARSGGSDITLGRGNLLEGSEAVVVNGERWTRDRDYTLDYDLGRLTLKRQLGPSDQLSVDYSYAPLFAQASKTLVGSSFRLEGRDRSLGGAFLYESKGAQDLRPRLGEEPSRTLLTDLNAEWRVKPAFLTRFADRLPGVRTTTPSEFNVQAEAGMSFPNPNTRNEVFVDDMEGVRDAVSLVMTPDRWRWSSVPTRATTVLLGNAVATQSFRSLVKNRNAEVHWFTPINTRGTATDNELTRERDLRPQLSDAQGAQNVRNVLAISVPRTPTIFAAGDSLWAGLTYNLDAVGLDLSRAQFIELWVNDWNDHHDPLLREARVRAPGVKLHFDLGRVSEDQMRAPNRLPNGKIDTEDQIPRDNQLTVIGDDSEDTGIDGRDDAKEKTGPLPGLPPPDLSTVTAEDPEGDDWGSIIENFPSALDPRRYLSTNGTENNRTAFPIPDTEDLNLNENPDTTEAYFEYTIDLADASSPYLVTDVVRDFRGAVPPEEPYVVPDSTRNGWRRYRIPLNDSLRVRFGFPDLTIAQHVRVWIEGLQKDEGTTAASQRPMLMLGGLDIVGSRWQSTDLTPRQRDTLRTAVNLNSVNTVDNADVYVAPFDPGTTRNGSQAFQRREQSLALEFTDLWPADSVEAFKTFSIPENYSRYGILRWYASSFSVAKRDLGNANPAAYDPGADSLYYFVRFSSDDRGQNYYELKRRLPRSSTPKNIAWEEVLARLDALSVVKTNGDFPLRDPILYRTALENGDSLILKGRPSFTRLLRVSVGVLNQSSNQRYTGQLWFDELRATDVAKDVGLASRVLVNGRVANVMDYNVAWNSRDANFLSVGETRGSGSRNSTLSVSTHFEPHRFFEGTGIQVPISFTQNQVSSRPRFTAGDDIVRQGALAEASETRSLSRTLSASYTRLWSERSNPFLRFTLGGINANISRSTSDSRAPTSKSKSTSVSAAVTYQMTPRQLLPVPLPFVKTRLFPLPERAYWNYNLNTTRSSAFTRAFGVDTLVQSSSQNGRAAHLDFGADTRPFDLLSHHIEGQRNLVLDGVRLDRLGFINLGRLTSWRQSFASHLALNPSPWIRPSFTWSSNYSQNNDTQSEDLSTRAIANGQELGMNWDLPFDRLSSTGMPTLRPPVTSDSAKLGKPARPARPLLPWRSLMSRLGAISTDGRIGRNSSYSRLGGTASPLYLAGLAENPGFQTGRIFSQAGNTSSRGLDWHGNARTNVPLVFGSSLQTRLSVGDRTTNNNGAKNRMRDQRFPDVELQYGRFANLIGLARFLEGPQLRTAYARNISWEYQNSRKTLTGVSRSDDFRPLFSVRGRLKNGADADFRFERRSSERQSFQQGDSKTTDRTTDINFSLTRSYSQGQKVNVLGKTTTVKTNINLSLTTAYSRQQGGVRIANQKKLANPTDRTRLSVNGTGSYAFSSTATGNLALGFSHFRETNGIVRRSIRIELRGQFRF
jgi:hypothetical protein